MAENDDTRTRNGGTKEDRKMTVTKTQAATGGIGGGIIVLMYVVACVKANTVIMPTIEQAAGILILVGPFLHLLGRIIMYWTGRLLPKDASYD